MATVEELVMPNAGEKITDEDFTRLVKRSQAIILYLQSLDLPVDVVDKLYHANDSLITAMRRNNGR